MSWPGPATDLVQRFIVYVYMDDVVARSQSRQIAEAEIERPKFGAIAHARPVGGGGNERRPKTKTYPANGPAEFR